MIPGFFAAGARSGESPPIEASPFFWSDPITSTGWEPVTVPPAIYLPSIDKTVVAWQFVGSEGNKGVHVAAFDHASKSWSRRVTAGTFRLTDDDHGHPSLIRDAEGYIHLFFGSHNTTQRWAVSNAPDDISAWRPMTGIMGGEYTYPKPVLIGSTIWLFLRDRILNQSLVVRTMTPSGGAGTWGSAQNLVNFGANTRVYTTEPHVIGGKIHFVCTHTQSGDITRQNVYYFVLDPLTGDLSSFDGATLVPAASLPVTLAQADADFKVFDHGSNNGDVASFQVDSMGRQHLLFADGLTPDYDLKHMMLDGGSWTAPQTVASITDRAPSGGYVDIYALVPGAGGEMQAWYNVGGSKVVRTRSSAGVWGPPETVMESSGPIFVQAGAVFNGSPEFRAVFSENAGSAIDSAAILAKLYAHGDSGGVPGTVDQTQEDPLWDDTTLLLSLRDGVDAAGLIDDSKDSRPATLLTAPIVSGGPFPGTHAAQFSSNSHRVEFMNSADLAASAAFTVECMLMIDVGGRSQVFITKRGTGANEYALLVTTSNEAQFIGWGAGNAVAFNVIGTTALQTGVWYHIVGEIEGATARVYVEGQLEADGPVSGAIQANGEPFKIGYDPSNASRYLTGKVSQIRVTQAARYGGNGFTPPAGPLPTQ